MHTLTEKIGIVNEVVSYMQNADNQTALAAKDFVVAPHIERLQAKLKTLGDVTAAQKAIAVQAKNKTAEAQTAAYELYNDASGTIDAMAGLLGKGTNEAQKLQSIRSKVRKHNDANPQTPPTTPNS